MEASAAVGLRAAPVLEGLPDAELERLAAAGRESRLAAGEFLFRQGDPRRCSTSSSRASSRRRARSPASRCCMLEPRPGRLPRRDGAADRDALPRHDLRGRRHASCSSSTARSCAGSPSPTRRCCAASCPRSSRSAARSRGSSATARSCSPSASSPPGLAHELNNPAAAAARGVGDAARATSATHGRRSPRSPPAGRAGRAARRARRRSAPRPPAARRRARSTRWPRATARTRSPTRSTTAASPDAGAARRAR